MTGLLESAIKRVETLSGTDQDAIAAQIFETLILLEMPEPCTPGLAHAVQQGLDDLDSGNYEEFTEETLSDLFEGVRLRGSRVGTSADAKEGEFSDVLEMLSGTIRKNYAVMEKVGDYEIWKRGAGPSAGMRLSSPNRAGIL